MTYITTISEMYQKYLPSGVVPNGEHYTVIANWEKRGIPIAVIRQAFADLFNANSSLPSSASDLEAFVLQEFREWLMARDETAVGRS
jgi:hypothetical protein